MIVFLKGSLPTLNYFIDAMSQNVKDSIILNTADHDFTSQISAIDTLINENTHVITFNNAGVTLRTNSGTYYWEYKRVHLHNIIVDAPHYFTKIWDLHMLCMEVIVVDRDYCNFMQKFYPGQKCCFLPHGGNGLDLETIPYESRPFDIVYFAGQKPTVPIETGIEQIAYNILTHHTSITMDEFLNLYLKEQNLSISLKEQKYILTQLYDGVLYNVTAYFQQQIISKIADAGIHLQIYGSSWKTAIRRFPDNVAIHGTISPEACISTINQSKIVLNIMPWFKDGTHERIFNAMLNQAICLTDRSKYLEMRFHDMEDIVFYDLNDLDTMIHKIEMLLYDAEWANSIIYNQKKSAAHDTWSDRLRQIVGSAPIT